MISLTSEKKTDTASLIYPDNLKERLLQYIYSAIFFSDKAIDSGIVNWNRQVDLYRVGYLLGSS
jgi:hypothetical protein